MLRKIKNNINLCLLKDYGFDTIYSHGVLCEYSRYKFIDRGIYGRATCQGIKINPNDRIIRFYNMHSEVFDKNWAKDLVDAGLTELCDIKEQTK